MCVSKVSAAVWPCPAFAHHSLPVYLSKSTFNCFPVRSSLPSVCVWLSICLSGDLWCQQLEHGCSLGAHVSRCHQLGRLSKPRCWIDPLCGDIYICISIPISGPVSYPAREGSRTRPLVLPVFYECSECPSVTCTASCLYMYI